MTHHSDDPAPQRILVAHQPAYLPWQGYFARLLDADRLVLLDHVQFAERGRQHRTWIRGPSGGRHLLSVPVRRSGRFGQSIREVEIAESRWAQRHWRTLEQAYRRAPYFDDLRDELCGVYQHPWATLCELNDALTRLLLEALGLPVRITHSSTISPVGRKTAMLIDLARRTGASILRVGTGAPRYLDAALLAQAGISVEIVSYTHHPYPQGGAPSFPASPRSTSCCTKASPPATSWPSVSRCAAGNHPTAVINHEQDPGCAREGADALAHALARPPSSPHPGRPRVHAHHLQPWR